MDDLTTCSEIAASVQTHERTARAVVDDALQRAAEYQERFRAFIAIMPDAARKQAERVDQQLAAGRRLPLAGVPFAVKDLIDVAGIPTTCGSRAFLETRAEADAAVVRRLTAAGAVLIGKLNLHECAYGFTGENAHFGNCRNPWNAERIAGGSSSGSAVAVALGICPLTLGSDTGGSIRQPAALCGLVGLKPTYGRVSRAGVVPLSWSMDHIGPLTRTASDAALVLRVLAGRDAADESTHDAPPVPDYVEGLGRSLQGVKLGVPRNWFFEALQPDVAQATGAAIDRLVSLGAERVEIALPHLEEVVGAHRATIFSEASSYYQPFLADRADKFDPGILTLLQGGLFLPAVDYLKAQRVRRLVRRAWADVFRKVDCLATPTTPIVATRFGQETADLPGGEKSLLRAYLDLTLPFNFSGHPALSVPCGFSGDRLPIGLQLVGRPFEEAVLLRLAERYQQATDWHTLRPPAA